MKIALKYRLLIVLTCVISLSVAKYLGLEKNGFYALVTDAIKYSFMALCYVTLLIEPEMILGRWRMFVEDTVHHFLGCKKWQWNLKQAILKAVLYCEVCITGQFALWGFLLFNTGPYSFLNHVFVVCTAMLTTQLIKELFLD